MFEFRIEKSRKMSRLKYTSLLLTFIVIWVNSVASVPAPLANQTSQQAKEVGSRSKYVEIKLPVKIASMDDLFSWVKNAMQNMASRIDVALGGSEAPIKDEKKSVKVMDKVSEVKINRTEANEKSAAPRNAIVDFTSEPATAWPRHENDLFAPLLNAEAYLPLFLGDTYADKFRGDDYSKYTYNMENQPSASTGRDQVVSPSPRIVASGGIQVAVKNVSSKVESSTVAAPKIVDGAKSPAPSPIPFAIPFEAFITITRETSSEPEPPAREEKPIRNFPNNQSTTQAPTTVQPVRNCSNSANFNQFSDIRPLNPRDYVPYVDERRRPYDSLDGERAELPPPKRSKKKESSQKRQLAALGDLLQTLGLIRKTNKNTKVQEAATTTAAVARPTPKPRAQQSRGPTFQFEDELPQRPTRNETSQRQEFDDDDDDEGVGGSLGSIADLLPLALPILQDLSSPDSETDLIELIEAAVPIVMGLSEGDDEEGGGLNEIIEQLVGILTRIVAGKDGQGSDLAALFGPIFSLIAPLIGPILAPLIGPLIRTISNPPTEGSSLAALVTAIAGPLSTPQDPSGMSPLSIVIAGTTAALLKELKPGQPDGSDVGALVGSILSGVLAGTSAGLSGGSSGGSGEPSAPYAPAPVSSASVHIGFPDRPSPRPPISRPLNRPSHHVAGTVNIGSTVLPPYSSTRPSYSHLQATVLTPQIVPSPRPQVHHHSGPVAAATGGNGGSSYLPTGTAVPANSVNPLALLGTSVKDILGAGIQVVSSLINAVFGILGASSMEQPSPAYGAPGPYGHASG